MKVIEPLWKVEREKILEALEMLEGNRTFTAKRLEIATPTLRRKIRQYKAQGFPVPKSKRIPRVPKPAPIRVKNPIARPQKQESPFYQKNGKWFSRRTGREVSATAARALNAREKERG